MCDHDSNGIVIGVVTDLGDEDSIGRVKVRYPHLSDQTSHWARMATLMAGPNRGAFFKPEKDDEVLVAFEHNDPRRPYILGALWSKVDTPPPDDGDQKKNNWRFFKSRSGHIFRFDDTAGAEKIELIDKDNKLRVTIDSSADDVSVICDSGSVNVTANAGTVRISASNVEIKATRDMTLTAGGTMTIKGTTAVQIN
jgi:uncharacterized protein involved in type VI secretion and phage assembly